MNLRMNELNVLLGQLEYGFPSGITFYSVDGMRVFQLRGNSGGVVSGLCCYLIKGNLSLGINIPFRGALDPFTNRRVFFEMFNEAIQEFEDKAKKFSSDGGDLGMPITIANKP